MFRRQKLGIDFSFLVLDGNRGLLDFNEGLLVDSPQREPAGIGDKHKPRPVVQYAEDERRRGLSC